MDYEAVRAGLQQAIPFNSHIGLEVVEVADGRGVVRLPGVGRRCTTTSAPSTRARCSRPARRHRAPRSSARSPSAWAASPRSPAAREISYLKLAKGPITATGTLGEEKPALLERLDADGKVEFQVEVELTDQTAPTSPR